MANLLKNLYREIRANALYDIIKYMVIAAVSLLFVFGYRILAWAREIPQDRVIDAVIFITAFLLLTIAYTLSKYRGNSSPPLAEAETQESQAPPPAERVFANVSPEYLMGFYREHTGVQAQKLLGAYIGKWMTISGTVIDVADRGVYWSVLLSVPPGGLHSAHLYFNKAWGGRISILKLHDRITVCGQIESVDTHHVRLENCEIVDSKSDDTEG